jgi:Uncharacterized protein conserved in bacteria (DUF2252)
MAGDTRGVLTAEQSVAAGRAAREEAPRAAHGDWEPAADRGDPVFGAFAAPDRRLVVDVNDFDEPLPGPWESDVKRLAASWGPTIRACPQRVPCWPRSGTRPHLHPWARQSFSTRLSSTGAEGEGSGPRC